MNADSLDYRPFADPRAARRALVRLLQNAHAGERAAANAYWGHAHSLTISSKAEREEILKIYREELHHRQGLKDMLTSLNAAPRTLREILMWLVGAVIAVLSFFGPWFISMYGARKLESTNIGEYEVAARLALLAGEDHLVDRLLNYAEVEWDHEAYFRAKVQSHWLKNAIRPWPQPASRESLRARHRSFHSTS